jgi:hypothetical protein
MDVCGQRRRRRRSSQTPQPDPTVGADINRTTKGFHTEPRKASTQNFGSTLMVEVVAGRRDRDDSANNATNSNDLVRLYQWPSRRGAQVGLPEA